MQGALPSDAAFTQALCADEQGFSLHAAVRYAADERQSLGQLCRYITRPALANERVQLKTAPAKSSSSSRPPGATASPKS